LQISGWKLLLEIVEAEGRFQIDLDQAPDAGEHRHRRKEESGTYAQNN
jgi:hypothetical protein